MFPSVEGNTYGYDHDHPDYEHRREGVYTLKTERVSRCTFIRLP